MSCVLTYCTNVLPGESLREMQRGLEETAVPLRATLGLADGEPFPLGLWLSAATVDELRVEETRAQFRGWLDAHGFSVATLNCFPYGGFHAPVVKRRVYRPGWHEAERERYTRAAADVLCDLLPAGGGSAISTLPGTHKAYDAPGTMDASAEAWGRTAAHLHRLAQERGRAIVLAIEPEPFCTLETTAEAVEWFQRSLYGGVAVQEIARSLKCDAAKAEAIARRHLGLCYDTCHQAVEFEDACESLATLRAAGIRIGKMQVSNAPALTDPSSDEAWEVLQRFVEPRYLHQSFALRHDGARTAFEDLPELIEAGDAGKRAAWKEVRTHFHIPIDCAEIPPLGTTRRFLERAVTEARRHGDTDLFEVETYTFSVLPRAGSLASDPSGLVASLARELDSARRLLAPPGGGDVA